MIDPLIGGIVAHTVGDWFLQNDWIARYKPDLRHPAAWIHGALHAALLVPFVPPHAVLLLTALHMAIDTRTPLRAWRRLLRQTTDGPAAIHVAFWQDQAAHLLCLVCILRGLG